MWTSIAQEKRQYFHLYRLSSGDVRTRKRKHLRTGGTPYNGLYGQGGGVPSYEMVGKSVISLSQK